MHQYLQWKQLMITIDQHRFKERELCHTNLIEILLKLLQCSKGCPSRIFKIYLSGWPVKVIKFKANSCKTFEITFRNLDKGQKETLLNVFFFLDGLD